MPLIFDLETDGFLADLTRIHCISIYDTETQRNTRYDADNLSIAKGVERLSRAEVLVGHNIIDFDLRVIRKLYPGWRTDAQILDTYIWGACTWPDIKQHDFTLFKSGAIPASLIGTHKLEAYGYRLGVLKGTYSKTTDWKTWDTIMSDYCEQDVAVTVKLYTKLMETSPPNEQLALESEVRVVLSRQMAHGVLFDKPAAEKLFVQLSTKMEELRADIQKTFPPMWQRSGPIFTPKRSAQKRKGEWLGYVADAPHQKIELHGFNPSSAVHIARALMAKYDWVPDEYADAEPTPPELQHQYDRLGITAGTIPTIDEAVLKLLPYPEAKPLCLFLTLKKRCSQLSTGKQAWLKNVDETSFRIFGAVNQFGAVTGRLTHFKPNLGQVPAVRSLYGKECRALFKVPAGYKLVGADASGLEARCKAHYIAPHDGGSFIVIITQGNSEDETDIHSLNRHRLVLVSRDNAKTWYYAFMYGAGEAKLGAIARLDDNYADFAGSNEALGKRLKSSMINNFPGLKKLIGLVKGASKRGWLKGLDGRKIPVRSAHSALNTLLQSAGAVVMKKALVIADNDLQALGFVPFGNGGTDYEFVLNVHDEWQVEAREEIAAQVGPILTDAIRKAGEHFKLVCPLAGEYKIGNNWAETH